MSIAAVYSAETALEDIRRRGRTDHPYQTDLAVVIPLRRFDVRNVNRAAELVVKDLTHKPKNGERELTTISARAGLSKVLVLIAQGYRQIGLAEVAAIAGCHPDTAQAAMAQLRDLRVLNAREVGRKGLSMTTYALAPRGAELLDQALSMVKGWVKAKAEARARYLLACKAARARKGQVGKNANRVVPSLSGSTTGQPDPVVGAARPGPTDPAQQHRRVMAMINGEDECQHGSPLGRCGICRRRTAS